MSWNATWEPFAEPNITAGFYNMTQYVSTVTNNYFGMVVIGALWIIFFMLFKKWGDMQSIATSSFMCLVIGMLFRAMNLVGEQMIFILIALTIGSLLLLSRKKD